MEERRQDMQQGQQQQGFGRRAADAALLDMVANLREQIDQQKAEFREMEGRIQTLQVTMDASLARFEDRLKEQVEAAIREILRAMLGGAWRFIKSIAIITPGLLIAFRFGIEIWGWTWGVLDTVINWIGGAWAWLTSVL